MPKYTPSLPTSNAKEHRIHRPGTYQNSLLRDQILALDMPAQQSASQAAQLALIREQESIRFYASGKCFAVEAPIARTPCDL
jgi:hypothetical protein